MHETAMHYGRDFFSKYVAPGSVIVEIGSQEVAGQPGLRTAAPEKCVYYGIDMEKGPGVDFIAKDPYALPAGDGVADAVVASSVLEHASFFWLSFLEMCRIVKPQGYIYVNVPSNGYVHRHPVDCWRFYPDAAQALTQWAERNGYNLTLIDSFIGEEDPDIAHWKDFVGIWRKA